MGWGSLAFWLGAVFGPAQPGVQLRAYSDLVRIDPISGAWMESARAPIDPADLSLPTDPLSLEAAKDEVLGFALEVSGSSTALSLGWKVLTGPGTKTSPISLEFFEVRSVPVRVPSLGPFIHALGPGTYPDVLVPTTTATPAGPRWSATVFVDLFVPRDAPVGLHRLELSVGERRLVIEVDVKAAILPAEDRSGLGAVSFGSFQARLADDPLAFRAAMQQLYAHRFNVELIPPWRPVPGADGAPDWESWGAAVTPYLDGSAFTAAHAYFGPRAGQPVSRFVVPVTEKWPSPKAEDGLPSDPEAFRAALRRLEQTLFERGSIREAAAPELVLFVNDLDEPKTPADFQALLDYAPLLDALSKRERIHFRVDGPFGSGAPGWPDLEVARRLSPLMDSVALCGAPPWAPREVLDLLLELRPKRRILLYASNTAGEPTLGPVVVDAPLSGLIAWGWIAKRNELAGILNWELDFRPGCAREPQCSGERQNLDATLVYRAEDFGGPRGVVYPSWRLKVLRRGAQDAALLSLLEEKDSGAARSLAALVIPDAIGEGPSEGLGSWPKDPRTWARVRARLHAELAGEVHPVERRELLAFEPPPARKALLFSSVLTLVLLGAWVARRLARRPGI